MLKKRTYVEISKQADYAMDGGESCGHSGPDEPFDVEPHLKSPFVG